MNIDEASVFSLYCSGITNQRILSEKLNMSLGKINGIISNLYSNGYIIDEKISEKGLDFLNNSKSDSLVILAAGFGLRMVPIGNETPKALLKIKDEVLIERIIKQAQDKGIKKIFIVVGYLKEKFEYLIDKYGVKLIYNPDYKIANNSVSLMRCCNYLNNSYIVPGDLYFLDNPFSTHEFCSYYLLSNKRCDKGSFSIGKNGILINRNRNKHYYPAIGLSFIHKYDVNDFVSRLERLVKINSNSFWEECFFLEQNNNVYAKFYDKERYYEINTFDDLVKIDDKSESLDNYELSIIKEALSCELSDIHNVTVLKKGMTNRSFIFELFNKKYIMRIPGKGTDNLINREDEANVYLAIRKIDICDNVIYINPKNGYKITEYIEGAKNCNAFDFEQVALCMKKLRSFHEKHLKVRHVFDLYERIEYYEDLWDGRPSIFDDYLITKRKILELKKYVDKTKNEYSLTHIDAVCDNFLIFNNKDIKLIDWEYAAMQDTDVDIAMNCIYALYKREEVDRVIDLYYLEGCKKETRIKIYCYIAICGLLWSNWCEYKRILGVEFGEYSLRQYRYAKEYYAIVMEELRNV